MDSINNLKGYNKVNLEHHLQVQSDTTNKLPPPHQLPNRRPIFTTFLISAVAAFTLLLFLLLTTLIHKSQPLSAATSSSSNSTINLVCHVTLHPQTCFTSISSLNTSPNPNLTQILNLSFQLSISELQRLALYLNTTYSNHDADVALKDCMEQVEDAMSQMKESTTAIMKEGEALTSEEGKAVMKDVQTWVSSAVTDEETCLDGLEEMGSERVEEVRKMMKKSMEFTSNSLAIVANFDKLVMSLH